MHIPDHSSVLMVVLLQVCSPAGPMPQSYVLDQRVSAEDLLVRLVLDLHLLQALVGRLHLHHLHRLPQ